MANVINGLYCATCEYWTGNRTVDKKGAKVSSTSEIGYCAHRTASKSTKHQANMKSCPKWAQWQQL